MDEIKRKKEDWFFLELVGIFMLPPVALYLSRNQAHTNTHLFVMLIAVFLLIAVVVREKMTLGELGINKKFLTKGFLPYLLFSIVGVLSVKIFAEELGMTGYANWWFNYKFLILFIPISIAQEFAYRSFLIPRLKTVFNDATTVVLVNAGLFTLLHLFYPEPAIILPLAFAGGLGFATLYYIYPNFWLTSFAHIIINFFAVSAGFFVIGS